MILSDSAVFLTKDERSYDSDSLLFITGFFFFLKQMAHFILNLQITFSPESRSHTRGGSLGGSGEGGMKRNPTALAGEKMEVYPTGEMVRDIKDPVERYLHTHSCTNCLIFISSITT